MDNIDFKAILEELGYWILFSVVIALAQLWLVQFMFYLTNKPWHWVQLLGNGSLLFFATTITSKTAGEYFKRVKGHHIFATLICLAVTFIIIIPSVFAYAIVTATRTGLLPDTSLSPDRVAIWSAVLAASGAFFSFSYTIVIQFYGE